jgi:isocitrate/isopropylmalate dehydrogenase
MARYERDSRNLDPCKAPASEVTNYLKKKINIICYQNYYEGVYERKERNVSTNTHTQRDKQTHTHTHAHKLKSYGRDSPEPRTRYRVIQHRRLCEQGESI